MDRRQFIQSTTLLAAGGFLTSCSDNTLLSEENVANTQPISSDLFFEISLAQWSLHRALWAGELNHLDFAAKAQQLGFDAIEYVSGFFGDKAEDTSYLSQMNQRAQDNDVKQLLIMVDGEGSLAGNEETTRLRAIRNHHKWVDAAKYLGCHSIRVNAQGKGAEEDVAARAVDSLSQLAEYAAQENINVLVENHGGYSSKADWLAGVMRQVNMPNCGTLPDFGNFTMNLFPPQKYDRYLGVEELMPFAKGVSAKSYDFDVSGKETTLDYGRLLNIVQKAGYSGHIGVEYEGSRLSEEAGILATRNLLIEIASGLRA